ncbi:MAG: chlorite dismutase family protein [Acidimicrobiia bacterium]
METSITPQNETGLYVSHLMVSLPSNADERKNCLSEIENIKTDAELKGIQFFIAQTFGHESDAIAMALAQNSDELLGIETKIKASGAIVVDSFLSICETSEYATTKEQEQARIDTLDETQEAKDKMMSDWSDRMEIYKKHKLFPNLPPTNMSYFCFYPMSKKREGENNWYMLSFEERAKYMQAHGALGRKYSGKVIQLITGATGLSDFEWGVCLFAKNLNDIKDIVYEMRFDKASALYGEFGHFTIGKITEPNNL